MRYRISTLTLVATLVCVSACTQHTTGPYQPLTEQQRSTVLAEKLNRQAVEIMNSDPAHAEELLREALTHDLYCGPAHNNLGVLYLQQGKLYEAANEFEWARKLLPGHPDPRMNLALTLELAGRLSDATETYSAALEVYPEHIGSMQGLARLQLRHGRTDNRTPRLLEAIALRGETEQWRQWAKSQLARMP